MTNMMRTAEKSLHKRTNKMLAGATKRYKKLMRQAAKAANAHKREQYVAAARRTRRYGYCGKQAKVSDGCEEGLNFNCPLLVCRLNRSMQHRR